MGLTRHWHYMFVCFAHRDLDDLWQYSVVQYMGYQVCLCWYALDRNERRDFIVVVTCIIGNLEDADVDVNWLLLITNRQSSGPNRTNGGSRNINMIYITLSIIHSFARWLILSPKSPSVCQLPTYITLCGEHDCSIYRNFVIKLGNAMHVVPLLQVSYTKHNLDVWFSRLATFELEAAYIIISGT